MIAAILLAAGQGRRFGAEVSKLVAPLGTSTVVRQTAIRLLASPVDRVLVVVGAGAAGESVRRALEGLDVAFVDNPRHTEGLGTSVAAGITALDDSVDLALVALGDQPSVSGVVVNDLIIARRRTDKPIIVPRYNGQRGNPVLFQRDIFPELRRLTGDTGAREIIEREPSRVEWLDVHSPMPADVDTPEDLERLRRGGATTDG